MRTPGSCVLRKQAAKLKIAAEREKWVLKSGIFALMDWFVGSLLIPKREMNNIVTNLKKITHLSHSMSILGKLQACKISCETWYFTPKTIKTVKNH